jgi:hypothetical protein
MEIISSKHAKRDRKKQPEFGIEKCHTKVTRRCAVTIKCQPMTPSQIVELTVQPKRNPYPKCYWLRKDQFKA